jgi:hypothetical protein
VFTITYAEPADESRILACICDTGRREGKPYAPTVVRRERRHRLLFIASIAFAYALRPLFAPAGAVEFLPGRRIFPPVVADPGEPKLAAEWFHGAKGSLQGFAFHIGALAPLLEVREGQEGAADEPAQWLQIGIDAGTLAILSDKAGFDLQAVDFQVGLPIDYRQTWFALRLRPSHVSSHLGDDFISRHPDFPRHAFSRDSVTLLASFEAPRLRAYGGGTYAFDAEPDVARETAQWGIEFSARPFWRDRLAAYLASDFQAKAENGYGINVNGQLGLMTLRSRGRNVRLAFRFFDGHGPVGQFFRERVRWLGVGIFYFPTVGPG